MIIHWWKVIYNSSFFKENLIFHQNYFGETCSCSDRPCMQLHETYGVIYGGGMNHQHSYTPMLLCQKLTDLTTANKVLLRIDFKICQEWVMIGLILPASARLRPSLATVVCLQIAKTLWTTSIGHRSDSKVSDRCPIDVHWNGNVILTKL